MAIQIENDGGDQKKYIRNVYGKPEEKGTVVRMHWDWPQDGRYEHCFVFTVTEAEDKKGITLEQMLAENRPREIISQSMPQSYTVTLKNTGQKVYFYPARLEKEGYYILNQKQQNYSEYLRKKLSVAYSVEYKRLGNLICRSNLQQAVIHLSFSQEDKPEFRLVYCCKGAGRDSRRFGLDVSGYGKSAAVQVVISKKEEIVFESLPPDMEDKVSLKKAN